MFSRHNFEMFYSAYPVRLDFKGFASISELIYKTKYRLPVEIKTKTPKNKKFLDMQQSIFHGIIVVMNRLCQL